MATLEEVAGDVGANVDETLSVIVGRKGPDSDVAAAKLASNVIREQLLDRAFRYHVTFSTGDVEITEVILNEEADSFTVAKLEIPGELRIAAVQRSNVVHIPEPGFELRQGDLVVAATTPRAHGKIRKYIEGGGAD